MNRPCNFDNKSAEEDIKSFRDWHWQLCQYLIAVDEGFASELTQINDDPSKALSMESASAETRQRSTKLYSLLASLVRNRALSIVRATSNSDGYEALRQLILNFKPNTQTRGLALLSALTSYPAFVMSKPLLSQLIRLEEMFEETRKSGTVVQDELKVAIVLKCVSGPLKTQLNLMLDGAAKYADVRDQLLRWDRSQQKWAGLVLPMEDGAGHHHDDAVPMEVDRIGEKNWKKGKGGKGKNKGDGKNSYSGVKGKGKTKSKGKDSGKAFQKGSKGKQQNEPKGKGKSDKSDKQCFRCGATGHFAKDCWAKIRNVQGGEQVQGSPSSANGSTTFTSVSQQNAQQGASSSQAQQGTQYRVSQISSHFGTHGGDARLQPMVFDLRQDPISPSNSASVRVVQQFYIGDSCEQHVSLGSVRVVVEEVDESFGDDLQNILIDSGADAAVVPERFATAGMASSRPDLFLHDAQGRQIPVMGMRDIEVHLMDETGRKVVLRESVAVSAHVQQPILCFGRLMQSGWGVDAGEQSLVHSTGVRIPLELQHQSVVVKGSIRAISSDVASVGVQSVEQSEIPGNVRAVKATVRPDVLRGEIGWHLDDSGLGLGRHIAETYQDPTLVRPGMHGFRNRTTLVKGDDGFWYVLELCEPLYSLIDMSAEFYGYDGMREVLTFITEGEQPPSSMGFSMNDDEGAVQLHAHHDDEGEQDPEIMAPEDAIQGREIAVPGLAEPLGEGREIPADRIVVDPAEYEKVVVNGVELSNSSFAQWLCILWYFTIWRENKVLQSNCEPHEEA